MNNKLRGSSAGFTLIELMVATAIIGIVMASIFSLYITMQRTTNNQENIVDVQQNLRVAVEYLSRDIMMAGALTPKDISKISSGSDATTLKMVTASSTHKIAMLGQDIMVPTPADPHFILNLRSPSMANLFLAGQKVRIIRPQGGEEPLGLDLDVVNVYSDPSNPNYPGVEINKPVLAEEVQLKQGDMVVRVSALPGAPNPSTITWDLNAGNLRRERDNNGPVNIVENISALAFSYLYDDGLGGVAETSTPTTSELENVQAVRVTLTAVADKQTDRVDRPRSISSVVSLRN